MLSHLFQNNLLRFFYLLSALWYGLAIFLLLMSILVWLSKGLLAVLPLSVSPKIPFAIAAALYSGTVLYAGFCFINTLTIQITEKTIPINNLPVHWHGKTIAHLSDLHLGPLWNEAFLKKIIKSTNQLDPEIIVITGDLFDGSSSDVMKYKDLLKQFRSKKGIFFVSGNHEVYAGGKQVVEVVKKSGITIIDNSIIDLDGLQLIGIGYPSFAADSPPFNIKSSPAYDPKKPSILLFHTPTDIKEVLGKSGASHAKAYLSPSTNFKTAADLGISLQLSGHSHAGQFFPFTWLTKRIYSNYHYGLHRVGDFHIYISSGTGTWGPPLRSTYPSEIAIHRLVPLNTPTERLD